jgi:hypothetical protein
MNTPTPPLVPVSIVASEVGVDSDTLAARHAADVITDVIGVRCLPTDLAQRLVADHRAAVQAQRARWAAQEAERRLKPDRAMQLRQRLRARSAAEVNGVPALAAMLAGEKECRLDAVAADRREMYDGRLTYHRLSDEDERSE